MSRKPVVRPSRERANPFREKQEYLTDPVFLLGNGTSRAQFDLERLRSIGTIIGCNAIFRDFSPDILLAIDAKMLRELKDSNYAEENFCILPGNRSIGVPGALHWRTERFNTTGCFGMRMVQQLMQPTKCYMLGMDGYAGNVYDGSKNYPVNSLQNFTGINSFYMKVLTVPSETIFYNVNVKDEWPKEAHETGNYKFITYDEFEKTVMG